MNLHAKWFLKQHILKKIICRIIWIRFTLKYLLQKFKEAERSTSYLSLQRLLDTDFLDIIYKTLNVHDILKWNDIVKTRINSECFGILILLFKEINFEFHGQKLFKRFVFPILSIIKKNLCNFILKYYSQRKVGIYSIANVREIDIFIFKFLWTPLSLLICQILI